MPVRSDKQTVVIGICDDLAGSTVENDVPGSSFAQVLIGEDKELDPSLRLFLQKILFDLVTAAVIKDQNVKILIDFRLIDGIEPSG